MEQFSAYIKNIVVFTLMMIFADIIMPDKYSKKYVNFILGIILAVNALAPFISLTNKNFNMHIFMESFEQKILDMDFEESNGNILFESIFKENIKNSIEKELVDIGFDFENVNVHISQNENGDYTIDEVEIKTKEEVFENAQNAINEKYAPKNTVFY